MSFWVNEKKLEMGQFFIRGQLLTRLIQGFFLRIGLIDASYHYDCNILLFV